MYFIFIAVMFGTLLPAIGCLTGSEVESAGLSGATIPVDLTYYTEQLPPYNYMENGTLQGISVDLLEEVTGKMGKKVTREEVNLVPWTEGYQAALSGNNTVLFSMVRSPEREQSFKWAGPIYSDRYVLFARRDSGITIESPEDLKGYRVGVIADDMAIRQLLDIGVNQSQLVPESNVSAIIGGLENNEIDLWACSEDAGRYFTEEVTGNYYSYTVVYQLETQDHYYAFSKDVPDSFVRSFQQALDAVKQEKDPEGISTYDRILGKYIPSIGLARLNYLTEEWAPFNYQEDGNVTGISVEILEAVFKNIGVNRSRADVRIVPLAEAFQMAQNNTSTVLFSIVRTPERESLYKWAGPFTRASFVLYAPVSSNITISSPEDIDRYRIGAVRASIENDLLASQGVNESQIINGQTPEALFRMLEGGQIDLWATGDLAGRHQMLQTAADPNAYEIVYTLSENDFYYIFSKDVPDTLVSAFQQALDTVRDQRDEKGVSDYERIIYRNLGVRCARQTFTDDKVMALVNTTAEAIEKNASDTFRRINAGEAPYRDSEDPGLYAFIYDTNLTIVAHADNIQSVGTNFRGKTDVAGKPFRDEILEGALKNGTGWVDYVYMRPVQTNLYYKTAYYRLTIGSDGNSYIVCSGNYKLCQNKSEATPANNSTASPEELIALVEKSFEYAHVNGQETALREFNNQTGKFVDGELYIFAYDTNGTTLALPFQPDIIGTNRWNVTDANGTLFIQDLISTAQSGGGFVRYLYADPADNFTVKQKLSYVMMVDNDWLIGAGIYNPPDNSSIVSVGTDPKVRDNLKSFVGAAITYADKNGKDAAITEFNNQNGTFVHDSLYVYAFDYNGITLALPYQPQLIGTDLSDLQDPYGVNYTKVDIFLAQQGGGFLFYHYYDPARNMTLEPKMSYVQKVDDTWWLGAGTYIKDLSQTA
ncbi:cystine transporter subunit [Methanosarcina siciliae T4/M]|uniref:Cystine transporter subunit n=1 Tax=Methanosarcina siciliae T4/M TaxID=1434120 RepID=A0A0E3P7X4_9EURY|nr:cache domain-containing protein [Methanosarcina siciliae]AKB29980.1 cystine transporter subunit [Methanosarcina siciliae T4/M]